MHRHIVLAFALALVTSIGCGSHEEAKPQTVLIPPAPKTIVAPVDGPYLITSDVAEDPARRVVEVKLNKKVTAEVLREIALELKAKEKYPHDRTVIFYYLPMEFPELEGVPWASTHFKPKLEVKILGLTIEEETALRNIPLDPKGNRIGAWLLDHQYKTLDVIYDEAGTIKILEIQSPTERSESKMVEMPSPTSRRFKKLPGSNLYDIDRDGNLRISNAEGKLLSMAKPMK